jgi:hypothetical protein
MRDQKTTNVLTAKAVTLGGNTTIRDEFPLGQGWYRLDLIFHMLIDINSSTGAITEGLLNIIRNIMLKTDIDGLCYNLSGRAIYRMAQYFKGTAPAITTLAATDGTYDVHIPLYFALPRLMRSEDTILDTARYRNIELVITYGALADLFSSPNADTVLTATLDVNIVHTEDLLHPQAKPVVYPYFTAYPVVNPASQTYIDIEKSPDLAMATLFAFTGNSVTAGQPFHGTAADTVLATMSVETQAEHLVRSLPFKSIQYGNKLQGNIETWPTGWAVMDFIEDGSVFSSISTGDKSKLQLNWINGTLSTSGITAALLGVRQLKGK